MSKMTDFEQLHSGNLYDPGQKKIMELQASCLEKLYDYNATRPLQQELRDKMLKEMFAEIGKGCYIEPPMWGMGRCLVPMLLLLLLPIRFCLR